MKSRSFGTHDGTFHADEVTACALLLLFDLIDRNQIIRSRDPKELDSCDFVCDVGGLYEPHRRRFDHHQANYQGQLSSAGMVLLYLKSEGIITANEYQFFNHSLVMGVDAHDNGKDCSVPGVCSFSHVISNFTPISQEATDQEQDDAFFEALDFTYNHLKRKISRYRYAHSCREEVKRAMQENKKCLLFDKAIPWFDSFFELGGVKHPAEFLIMPSGSHWKLRGIPPTYDERMEVRRPLPIEWAGLLEGDLKRVSGIPGAVFCHKGRFISVWETQEDALKALRYVLGDSHVHNL